MNLERAIFNNLLNNETYARKTIPFLKPEYFHSRNDKVVFELINSYVMEYNAFPTKEALLVDLNNRDNISEDQFKECKEIVEEIPNQPDQLSNVDWLVDQTEKFCQDKATRPAALATKLIRFSYASMRNKPQPLSVDNKRQNRRYLMY